MTASRYALTAVAMALVCVNFVVAAGSALLPPDAASSPWLLIGGFAVSIPLTLAYYGRDGSVRALWRYLLAILAGTFLLGFVLLPAASFVGAAAVLQGLSGFLVLLAVYVVALLFVYGDAWTSLKRYFVRTDRRGGDGPRER